MERIWKLTVSIFWIVMSTALVLLAYVLSGNQYSPFAIIMVYGGLIGLAIGIIGGLYTLVAYRTGSKETNTENGDDNER